MICFIFGAYKPAFWSNLLPQSSGQLEAADSSTLSVTICEKRRYHNWENGKRNCKESLISVLVGSAVTCTKVFHKILDTFIIRLCNTCAI